MLQTILLFLYLIFCSYTDIKTKKISLKISFLFFILGLCFTLPVSYILNIFHENLLPGILLFILSFLLKGAIGAGDAIIFFIIGFYVDKGAVIYIIFLSLFSATLYAGYLLFQKHSRKESFPFAPFIFIGYISYLILFQIIKL